MAHLKYAVSQSPHFYMENFRETPYLLQKYVVVPLEEPIYGTSNYAVRDKWLFLAKRTGRLMLIRTPHGQEIIHPQKFMDSSTKFPMEKYIPGHPMTMYQRTLKLEPLQDIEKYRMDW
jgi:hypothetical protein